MSMSRKSSNCPPDPHQLRWKIPGLRPSLENGSPVPGGTLFVGWSVNFQISRAPPLYKLRLPIPPPLDSGEESFDYFAEYVG